MDDLQKLIQSEISDLNNNKFSRLTDNILKSRNESTRKVCQYSLDGGLIKTFGSIKEAARDMNTTECHITAAIFNNRKKGQAGLGYIWAYEGEKIRITKEELKKGRSRPFLVFNKNFDLVGEFNSYLVFCEFLQIQHTKPTKSTICKALLNQKKYKGYWLVYKHEYKVGMTFCQSKANSTKIKQFTLNGELLREFKSLRELENITGINRKKLSEHLKNNGDVYNGFRFEIIITE